MTPATHRYVTIKGIDIFYREAGCEGMPVILLPHGYPCSSYEFRNLMPRLADRWRLLAPDFPGAGYSATPDDFDYSFDGYAEFLDGFVRALGVERFALFLHDFGSPIGVRLAIKAPERVVALVIQNGDIPYEDALGPKYAEIEKTWRLPRSEMRETLAEAVKEEIFKEEFLNNVRSELAERIPPDLWKLHWFIDDTKAQGDCGRPDRWFEGEPRLVPATSELPRQAPSADDDRIGAAGQIHARALGACLSSGSPRRGAPPAGWRSLAFGNQPGRGGLARSRLSRPSSPIQRAGISCWASEVLRPVRSRRKCRVLVASAGHRPNREPTANHVLCVFRAKTRTKSRREGLATIAGSSRAFPT
ncbi:alpha/beta fold hydrolase [Rhizobium sp. 007]|uniref:alpha/beta fold hydrolase n=1 Tax=Rhizobium sp. 007 TaxID=2785056 RepID=UPI001FEDD048|nr:alpha/beta fold hydrolase [Rhizobium sp. 007]